MNFELNENQLMIQKTAKDFAQKELLPQVIENDENSRFPLEAYKKIGQMGFLGLPYSEEYGGVGGDYLSYALAVEEISKIDASLGISYSVTTSLCCGSIMNGGTEEQKKKYLPDLLSGKKLGSFGLTEPNAGSDAANAITTAVKEGEYYVLNGSKCFITNAPLADIFVVYAMTDRTKGVKGLSAFIIEKDYEGFSIGKLENKCGIRAAQVAELIFDDVKVPAENLLGGVEGQGFKVAMKTLDGGRIGVAAQGLGIAEGAFDMAKEYMKQRVQFGKPICKNQALAFKMADLALEIEQAKYLLYKAAIDKHEGKPYSVSAAKAKLACTNAAMHVTVEAVQMMGGNGFMREYHVERMMRDAKITQIYEGTNEIQKLIISGDIFK